MKILRKVVAVLASVSMLASFAVMPVLAENDTALATLTYDNIARVGNTTNYGALTTLELHSGNKMYPMFRFAIPQTDSAKVIKSVTLRLVSERVKSNVDMGIYTLSTDEWTTENTGSKMGTGAQLVTDINTALSNQPIATFKANGTGKALTSAGASDKVGSDFATVDKWTTNIQIPVSSVTSNSNFDIIISGASSSTNISQSNKFFSKEATLSTITNTGFDKTDLSDSDLHPQLTIEYQDKPVVTSVEISGDDKIGVSEEEPIGQKTYTAKVYDQFHTEMTDQTVTWGIGNGTLTGVTNANGSYTVSTTNTTSDGDSAVITASVSGTEVSASKTVTVEKRAASVPASITVSGDDNIETAQDDLPVTKSYSAVVYDQYSSAMANQTVTWEVKQGTKVSISNTGVLTVEEGAKTQAIKISASVGNVSKIYEVNLTVLKSGSQIVYASDANTEWKLHEVKGGGTATSQSGTVSTAGSTVKGDYITLTSTSEDNNNDIIQARKTMSDIKLGKDIEYTFSVDYEYNIEKMNSNLATDPVIYAVARAMYLDGSNKETQSVTTGNIVKVKQSDTDYTGSGTITGKFTPNVDNSYPEIMLYIRHAKGSVTYKNLKITRPATDAVSVNISGADNFEITPKHKIKSNTYTASAIDAYGLETEAEFEWSIKAAPAGTFVGTENNGKYTVSTTESATDGATATIAAKVKDSNISGTKSVSVQMGEDVAPSVIYPTDDVLFRAGNTDAKNVNSAEVELRNTDGTSDRAFVGGLKFDITGLKDAVTDKKITSIKLRLTTVLSRDQKLNLKPFSNDWNEQDATVNSYDAKKTIIDTALLAPSIEDNDDVTDIKLNRFTKAAYIYANTRVETETIKNWQTEIDITDYMLGTGIDGDTNKNGYLNGTENQISFLVVPNYNGADANKYFSKDIDSSYANYSALVSKFTELQDNLDIIKPAIVIEYATENVAITAPISSVPVPVSDIANSIDLSARYHNPMTEETSTEIVWSLVDNAGNATTYEGVSIDASGKLSVTKTATEGNVIVRAAYAKNVAVYSDITIEVAKLQESLKNGSFEDIIPAMMPKMWTSYDPAIADEKQGVQHYDMNQLLESALSNVSRTNDDEALISGKFEKDDTASENMALKFVGAEGITAAYEGFAYISNRANASTDGGPDLRVTSGISYWVSQDYRMSKFYQLDTSKVNGPYLSYEGFQGTTSKKSQFGGSWYIKDGNASTEYTTNTQSGYQTLLKQITVPQNVNRLGVNWCFKGAQGTIYYRNFNLVPQGIDTTKTAVDGKNTLKVTDKMSWTSHPIAVSQGEEYTYRFSAMTDNKASIKTEVVFKASDGTVIDTQTVSNPASTAWVLKDSTVTVPNGSAYAQIVLKNGASNGDVWYDNVVFAKTSTPVVSSVKISENSSMYIIPQEGTHRYNFDAKVSDQFNDEIDGEVVWSVDRKDVSITSGGILLVSNTASEGSVTVTATVSGTSVTDSVVITLTRSPQNAQSVTLVNGSFSDIEDNIPVGWTDSDMFISLANATFDTSLSGWGTTSNTYAAGDSSADVVWDGTVDHTQNNGGAAKIENIDRALGYVRFSNNIDIQGGHTYKFSVWVKTDNVSTDSNVYADILTYDKNGTTLDESKNLLVLKMNKENPTDTSDWTELTGQLRVPNDAIKLRVDLRYRGGANNQNGTVWYDDLKITKLAGMDNGALVLEGYELEDFELTRGYGEKWDSSHIEGITPGQDYVYSVKVKTFNANKGAYVKVSYYDEADNLISETLSDKVISDTETEIKGVTTAPVGAKYAVMSLCIDGAGRAWFNDANFETKAPTQVKAISIIGSEAVSAPSINYYSVEVTDQYGFKLDNINIEIDSEALPTGVAYDKAEGKLSVLDSAKPGEGVTLRATYGDLVATKAVSTLADTESISINGPQTVTTSPTVLRTYTYALKNQAGQTIKASDAVWSVTGGLSIANGVLSIPSGTSAKTVTITASYDKKTDSKTVTIKADTNTAGSNGGGGGGGGGNYSGGATANSGTTSTGTGPMGNFGSAAGNAGDNNSGNVIPDAGQGIIPQPDPNYFTQGMENIGGFSDIATVPWAQKAIVSLSSVKIINGKGQGRFAPNDNITRAEFVKILMGTLEYGHLITDKSSDNPFTDLSEDWYVDSVSTAYKYGIVTGRTATTFAPYDPISRQEMCVMINRAMDTAKIGMNMGAEVKFNDEADIESYAKSAVVAMSRAGIVSGFLDGTFKPHQKSTRAQAAVMIYRMAGGTQ